ncbi:hypothetical protein JCM10212_001564 [Sporobolomyces blumeae]
MRLYPGAFLIAALASGRGLRNTSLSPSGAVAALVLGYSTLASDLRVFGVCLLGFYLAGSRATKVKAAIKATYEEPEVASVTSTATAPSKPTAGRRTATQVACNALVGTTCAIFWRALFSGEFASELGILSRAPPILVTRPLSGRVPRGTNGGVTVWGTFVSLLGGLFVGSLAVVTLLVQGQGHMCQDNNQFWWFETLVVAALSGLGGSFLDSLLGALLQPTYYSPSRKMIVHSPHTRPAATGGESKDVVELVQGTGRVKLLGNNGVNAVMGLCTAATVAWWAS